MPTPTDDEMLIRTARAEVFRIETMMKTIKERVKTDPAYTEVVLVELKFIRRHLMSIANFKFVPEEAE